MQEVSLSFLEYSTDPNSSDPDASLYPVCLESSSVRLYDGADQGAPNIASFCNKYRPSPAGDFRSTGNQLLVTMETPCSFTNEEQNGSITFRASVRAVNTLAELAAGESSSITINLIKQFVRSKRKSVPVTTLGAIKCRLYCYGLHVWLWSDTFVRKLS